MTLVAQRMADFAEGLDTAFAQAPEESTYKIDAIEGEVPTFLRGTYYLNGPARFEFDSSIRYRNWLDGDGMVSALRFANDGFYFVNRYVRGRKYLREREEFNAPVYRAFGTAFPGDRLKRGMGTESPYNVSVFPYRDKLFAFGEQSLPMQLDSVTLQTLTPGNTFDFDRALNDASPFSAHPKIDHRTGELLNFGIFFAPDNPLLIYYRFDEDGKLACRSRVPIDLPSSLHDFAASTNYVVFYLSPYILDTSGLTERGLATIDSLSWQPERGSQLLVLCRKTGHEIARIPIEGRYCLHTINAFEQDGRLVVDVIEFERPVYDQYQVLPNLFEDVPFGQPVRFVVAPATQKIVEKKTINYWSAPDFPAIDPHCDSRPYDDLWMLGISSTGQLGRKFFDRLVHVKWSQPDKFDIWACPHKQFLGGEPVVVRDPAEPNRGVIVCHIFDASVPSSRFAIFDAAHISVGPFASLRLTDTIHLGFHACFAPNRVLTI